MEGSGTSRIILLAAFITALGAVAAALISNLDDDSSSTTPTITGSTEAAAAGSPRTQRKPEAATGEEERATSDENPPSQPPRALTRTSIVELREEGKAEHLGSFEGDYGTQSIGGRSYPDGVSMLVYSDGSGQPKLAILTEGRFSKISGVVGIDGSAQCIEAPASVSIVDDRGALLWGPQTVHARSRVPFSADLSGAVRIYLAQASLESGEEVCGANPAWGSVYLTGPAGA
jgi:hypothetical protein